MRQRSVIRGANALSLALLCATPICAAAEGELFEEHHAHEHGVATLEVAVDASRLALQFRSPAMNLLGFEHPPRTAQDTAAVARAMKWLRDPATQFQPSADARCSVTRSDVVPPDWEHSAEHAEFAADYEFHCKHPAALQHLEVRLLEQLVPDVKFEVQVASPAGQHSTELTRANTRLPLRSRPK